VILDNGSTDICGAIFVCMYVIRITDGVKIGVKIKCKLFAALE
jgi:hypothetical protein